MSICIYEHWKNENDESFHFTRVYFTCKHSFSLESVGRASMGLLLWVAKHNRGGIDVSSGELIYVADDDD